MAAKQQPARQEPPAEPLVRIRLLNAHATSGGNGPGIVEIPRSEAAPLLAARYAIEVGNERPANLRGVAN